MSKHVLVRNVLLGNDLPFVLIAGPCVLESRQHAFDMCGSLRDLTSALGIPLIYKTSWDKANRTSINSFRGLDFQDAIYVFRDLRRLAPVLTDVHEPWQCDILSDFVDVLQIPAFLCRQTDLLAAAAKTGKPVNVKKGQFLAPGDMTEIVKKLTHWDCEKILLTERGASFGYNNLVNDMRSLPIMAATGWPVVFDATHSVQQPGGLGSASGGQRQFIAPLARAAVAVGVAAVFIETHQNPDKAPSDGPSMLPLKDLKPLLESLLNIDRVVKRQIISNPGA